jgi:hypothetical protein
LRIVEPVEIPMIEPGRLLFRTWALRLAALLQRLAVGRDSLDVPGDAPVGSPNVSAHGTTPRGGPPPHWVERVRAAAPHLLRPEQPTAVAPIPSRNDPSVPFRPRSLRPSRSEARERSSIERRKGTLIPEDPGVSGSTLSRPFVPSPAADPVLVDSERDNPAAGSKRDETVALEDPAPKLPRDPASTSINLTRGSAPMRRRRANWLRWSPPPPEPMPALTAEPGESPSILREDSATATDSKKPGACDRPESRTSDGPDVTDEHSVRRADRQVDLGTGTSDPFAPLPRSRRSIEVVFHEGARAQLGRRRVGTLNQKLETRPPLTKSEFGSEPPNSPRPRPNFPELPVRKPEDVTKAESQEAHWAELPPVVRRDPRDDWLEHAREQEHQARLEREQRGLLWTV